MTIPFWPSQFSPKHESNDGARDAAKPSLLRLLSPHQDAYENSTCMPRRARQRRAWRPQRIVHRTCGSRSFAVLFAHFEAVPVFCNTSPFATARRLQFPCEQHQEFRAPLPQARCARHSRGRPGPRRPLCPRRSPPGSPPPKLATHPPATAYARKTPELHRCFAPPDRDNVFVPLAMLLNRNITTRLPKLSPVAGATAHLPAKRSQLFLVLFAQSCVTIPREVGQSS